MRSLNNIQKKIAFTTLGCRLNQFETDSLVGQFADAGYKIVPFEEEADVYIINTCTITGKGEQKSRNMVNRARKKAPHALIVVTGCSVEKNPEYFEMLQDITLIVDNGSKHAIFSQVDALLHDQSITAEQTSKDLFDFPGSKNSLHTRCAIKIQDGCNNFCTYCIVPYVRGRAVSRPLPDIMQALADAVKNGYKEIVLTGVNISKYSYEKTDFTGLVSQMLAYPGDFRIRISSLEPDQFTPQFAELFSHPKLCHHLHLCLQSGSDNVLKLMKRNYSVSQFREIINMLKSKFPLFNVTTDIIVGFPGESGNDFEESCQVAEELAFSHIHTFKFSEREGTRAANFSDKISEAIKQERSQRIRLIAAQNKKKQRALLLGAKQRVLIERVSAEGFSSGYGDLYIPIIVQKKLQPNSFYDVTIIDICDDNEQRLLATLD